MHITLWMGIFNGMTRVVHSLVTLGSLLYINQNFIAFTDNNLSFILL